MPIDDNEQQVRTRELSYKELVQKTWGKDWKKPDPAYEFSGRTFESTDRTDSGIYEQD